MYRDDKGIYKKKKQKQKQKKQLEIQIERIRIYSQNVRMEFGIKKWQW